MAVTLMCPNLICRKILAVPEGMRGKRVRCGYCGTTFAVPWAAILVDKQKEAALAAEAGSKEKRKIFGKKKGK